MAPPPRAALLLLAALRPLALADDAGGNGEAAPLLTPPEHPVFERFQFLRVLHVHRPRHAGPPAGHHFGGNRSNVDGAKHAWGKTLRQLMASTVEDVPGAESLANSWPFFPDSLENKFEAEKKLGSGSFGTTFLAKDNSTGDLVAVKVLSGGSNWLTPSMADQEQYKFYIDESKEECTKIKQIHRNSLVDSEGQKHVVQCIEDGITQAMSDPAYKDQPLYIVMDFVGDNAQEWWEKQLPKAKSDAKETSRHFRTVSRDMMLGLRFMTHKEAPEKWVHHDLKPPNMAVLHKDGQDPKLTLIDLGTAVSEKTPPTKKIICTPIYQPPELLGLRNSIGYSLPIHSFDASSSALTMLGMAGNPKQQTLVFLPGQITPFPIFVQAAIYISIRSATRVNTLSDVAACIHELNGYQQDDFAKWVETYEECMHRERTDKYAGEALERMFNKVRNARTPDARREELTSLIGCNALQENQKPGTPELTHQIVSEWVSTDFDKVLMKMMELDPKKRPTPEEVLQAKWLKDGYVQEAAQGAPPEVDCKPFTADVEEQLWLHYTLPFGMIQMTCIFAVLFCCLGGCCHVGGKVPSTAFTATVACMFVFATGGISTVWMTRTGSMLLVCISFLLGPALLFTGCTSVRRTPSDSGSAWVLSLFLSAVFFLILFIAFQWLTGPSFALLSYIDAHFDELKKALEKDPIFAAASFIKTDTDMLLLKTQMRFTFLPPLFGLVTVGFGIWREHVHGRLFPRQGPVVRDLEGAEGMELPTTGAVDAEQGGARPSTRASMGAAPATAAAEESNEVPQPAAAETKEESNEVA